MFSPTIEAITIEEIKDIFCTDYSNAEIQKEKRSGLIGKNITASVYLTNIKKEENTLDSNLADSYSASYSYKPLFTRNNLNKYEKITIHIFKDQPDILVKLEPLATVIVSGYTAEEVKQLKEKELYDIDVEITSIYTHSSHCGYRFTLRGKNNSLFLNN